MQAACFATWLSAMTQALWADGSGFHFSENEVLHLGMIPWLGHVVLGVGPTLRDAPEPSAPAARVEAGR